MITVISVHVIKKFHACIALSLFMSIFIGGSLESR